MGEGFFDKVKLLVGLEGEEIEEAPKERRRTGREYVPAPAAPPAREVKDNRVINFQATRNQMKLILLEPKSFDECPKIVDHLKNRKPIILNLEKLDSDLARKVFDFISGAVYALDGNVQKVANNIFLFAPENVDIAGNIENHLNNNDFNPWRR
ncbi:MAG: cell division protein SepF [Clostridiales bacterium]|nr:cell division protein SepF [Clostridiales bacterium]